MEEKKQNLALIMPSKQKDLLVGAIIFLKESLLEKFPNFDLDKDCFISFGNDLPEIDFKNYQKILVIDPSNKLLKIESSILKNYYKELVNKLFWYSGKSDKILTMQKLFGQNNVQIYNNYYFKSGLLDDYELSLLSAIQRLQWKTAVANVCPKIKRMDEAIRVAKLKDKENNSQTLLTTTLKQLFSELITKNESQLIVDLITEFEMLKEGEKRAKRSRVEHSVLGLLKLVKPKKGSTVQNKTFFEQGFKLGYNAVAVRSENNKEYELCLRNNLAKKIADEIPAIKKINGCRFIVTKEFLIQGPIT